MEFLKTVFFLFFVAFTNEAYAYPHFVGLGYTSCITCHYNPFGNGPLNDYGRALSATAVSARWFYPDYKTEEQIADQSGFFFERPKNDYFRPSFDYRGLLLKRDFGEDIEDTEYINMMADFNVVFKNKAGNYFFSTTLGYAPRPKSLKNSDEEVKKYRLREMYVGARPWANIGLYAGLMDKIYGIRVAEHSSYSRSITNLSQNDQSYGVQAHWAHSLFEAGFGYFVGNLVQDAKLRQKGWSTKIDYIISHKSTVGISYLSSSSEFLKSYMQAFHFKTTVGKGSAFMAEYGKVTKEAVLTDSKSEHQYGFAQAYLKTTRGIYLINSLEYLREMDGDTKLRFGPGIQVFPIQRLEFRFELYNSRNFSDKASTKDSWDFLGQVHSWF